MEEHEEEVIVYLDFGKFIPASEINDLDLQFKVVGLDSDKIYSEVNGKVFEGTYEDSFGTHLFFAEVEDPPKSDNIFERTAEKTYSLLEKTDKYIAMKRIFVSPKNDDMDEEKLEEGTRTLMVDKTYQEALDQLLKPGQVAPRTVTDALDNKIILQRDLEMDCNN